MNSKFFLFGTSALVLAAVMLSQPSFAMEGNEEDNPYRFSRHVRQKPGREILEGSPTLSSEVPMVISVDDETEIVDEMEISSSSAPPASSRTGLTERQSKRLRTEGRSAFTDFVRPAELTLSQQPLREEEVNPSNQPGYPIRPIAMRSQVQQGLIQPQEQREVEGEEPPSSAPPSSYPTKLKEIENAEIAKDWDLLISLSDKFFRIQHHFRV